MFFKLRLHLILTLSTLLVGCSSLPIELSDEDSANIHVSRPLIFSKESLVRDRINEQIWLQNQLLKPYSSTIQGKRFTRDFSVSGVKAAVDADPLSIKNYRAQQELNLNNTEYLSQLTEQQQKTKIEIEKTKTLLAEKYNETAISNFNRQIETAEQQLVEIGEIRNIECAKDNNEQICLEKRQEYIDALKIFSSSLNNSQEILTKGQDGSDGESESPEIPTYDLPSINESIGSIVDAFAAQLAKVQEALKVDENDTQLADLKISATGEFEDALSYRKRIRDEIAKNSLDERHDAHGNALYRFQFNLSVIPRSNNPHWAKVIVKLEPTATTLFPNTFFKRISELAIKESQSHQALLERKDVALQKAAINDINKLEKYYLSYEYYLPRSITSFTNQWLAIMESELSKRFSKIHDALINDKLSVEQEFKINRQLALVCFPSSKFYKKGDKYYSKVFQDLCDQNKKFKILSFRGVDLKNISDLNQLVLNQKDDNIKKELKPFKHYLALRHAYESMQKDFDFQYVDLNIKQNTQKDEGRFFFTWKEFNKSNFFSAEVSKKNQDTSKSLLPEAPENYGQWRLISDLLTKQTADVYAVSPIEETQRVEDIAEISRLFGASVGAKFLAGNTGGELALEYLKGKEKLLSTILRKPVVLGLPGTSIKGECKGKNEEEKCNLDGVSFGWLIGPIYQIDENRKGASFTQIETIKTVAADISIPSWWKSLKMSTATSWIDSNSLEEYPKNMNFTDQATRNNPIRLNSRHPNVEKIFSSTHRSKLSIAEEQKERKISLKEGKSYSFVIEGKDLWRVTHVTLGGMKSKDIEVLGDMNSIRVGFEFIDEEACLLTTQNTEISTCKSNIKLWSATSKPLKYSDDVTITLTSQLESSVKSVDISKVKQSKDGFEINSKTFNLKEFDKETVYVRYSLLTDQNLDKTKIKAFTNDLKDISKDMDFKKTTTGVNIGLNFPLSKLWRESLDCQKKVGASPCTVSLSLEYDGKLIPKTQNSFEIKLN